MRHLLGLAAIAAICAAVPAAATTIDLSFSGDVSLSATPSVYTVANNFVLPAGISNAVLTITNLSIDDRGALFLNGNIIDSAGIATGGLTQTLTYTFGGPNLPFTYAGYNGARNTVVTGGLLTGTNLFSVLVNDTSAGIAGAPLAGTVYLSGYSVTASLRYDEAAAALPEPASWAMLVGGFGLVGGALRSRRRASPACCQRSA